MSLVVSDLGIEYALEGARLRYAADGLLLKLFKNNFTPDRNTTIVDLTECNFDGYGPLTITGWTLDAVVAHVSNVHSDPMVFTKSAGATPNDVYGYFVTDSTGATMYWSERVTGAPFTMSIPGQTFTVIVNYSNYSQYP